MINESSGVSSKAALPSLIEEFEIVGLHGYRDISISPQNAAAIFIAKNGTGKTTLLGALDAFLKLQFNRLRKLEFAEIRCKFSSIPYRLVLSQIELTTVRRQNIWHKFELCLAECLPRHVG